jgi:membrane protein
MSTGVRVDRERIVRTLTFWLRPAFLLRVLNRFQVISGFDRAVALASSALTALIPLAILLGTILPHQQADSAAHWIIDHYDLTGKGADAVNSVFSSSAGSVTDIGLLGLAFLVIATLSFSRGTQRLFEQTWELKPLSVRNTPNDLVWLVGLVAYLLVSALVHRLIDTGRITIASNLVVAPVTAAFLAWSGYVLSAKRIPLKDLLPFAIVGAVALAIYFTGAAVYVPHQFSAYANRYGVIGAVFAMISALFCVMVVLTGSAAVGREVRVEFGRISRGERPSDDEIAREWNAVITETRSRWATLRDHIDRRRSKRE